MPSSKLPQFIKELEELKKTVIGLDKRLEHYATNQTWVIKIVVGAAGLGFLEKILGWWLK